MNENARAEFSFRRVRGLRIIFKFHRSVAEFDSTIQLFGQTQSLPELQVIPTLFQHSLKEPEDETVANLDHIFGLEPLKITSPSSNANDVALALRVLEGCCLLHSGSTVLAYHHNAIQLLRFQALLHFHPSTEGWTCHNHRQSYLSLNRSLNGEET
ncbi:hypothetical protein CIPAW_05G199600 [Carya illinoinensis]|uniref:Uncharacterized protein n=1 Tax=Carya illinoinensis TaxID=32201 RepID=A0A8T1QMJ5_CARIL|nr:hypothetical protein CIPAW_05G199600 [Carya illinoinensis]KAG6655211.1 hypothetical protein CIPAW_05G199600 [Carya illinoinensis]KAG6655212.1 hypothetical protein CIPAW_05G199600 [Carya illinoinensis]